MANTFYFSHDYSTRNDEKIKRLLRKHGALGYGLFWFIIEDLYNNNNNLTLDYEGLAFDYRADENTISSVINDFDLFVIDGGFFGSKSVEQRIIKMQEKSKIGKDNALKRWGNDLSRAKAEDCIFYVVELFNEKERFVKCGITSESISRRFSGKTMSYKYEVLFSKETTIKEGLKLEAEISNQFPTYSPQDKIVGYLECYGITDKEMILEIALQHDCKPNAIKESKGKEIKESKSIFVAPLLSEVELYFKENGFNAQYAKHVFDYYALNDWKDASGKKVKSWKQKMKGVWLSEEKRKPNNQINQPTYTSQERFFKNGIEMIRTADGGAVSVIEFNKMFG